jgi:hypothetical protein
MLAMSFEVHFACKKSRTVTRRFLATVRNASHEKSLVDFYYRLQIQCSCGFHGYRCFMADTVKVGVLHSLSGTMAISETSLRDILLFTFDEINAKGGVMGKKIEPVVVDPAFQLAALRRKGQAAARRGQGRRDLRLLDFGEPQVRAAGLRERQRPALLPRAV